MEIIIPEIQERFSRLISYFPILFLILIPAFLFRMTGDPAERETPTFHFAGQVFKYILGYFTQADQAVLAKSPDS